MPAGSLPGFLRQHYTTSSDMAGVLAGYLISNGANDPRYQGKDHPRGAKGGRQEATQSPEQQTERPAHRQRQGAAPQEAAKPDADGLTPEGRPGHRAKRAARPSEAPEAANPADGQPQGAGEGRPSRKKLGRRGKPAEELKPDEGARSETPKDESKGQSARTDSSTKSDDKGDADKSAKPADQSDSAKVEAPKGERPDPVPPVTPAPPAAAAAPSAAPAASPAPAATAPEPAASPGSAASPTPAPPVTATAPLPPAPSGPPAGPPAAPVSR
ncbi:hypothetical protein [Bradyrhizobium semiaridum]|uniref:hypothetical protein n=1 Tax=Bradyrhizobium semiaridum TaxID=2821404 RepID=UPI002897ED92|nr:hypothetical protein [Bradyrhizobium semiaridum]